MPRNRNRRLQTTNKPSNINTRSGKRNLSEDQEVSAGTSSVVQNITETNVPSSSSIRFASGHTDLFSLFEMAIEELHKLAKANDSPAKVSQELCYFCGMLTSMKVTFKEDSVKLAEKSDELARLKYTYDDTEQELFTLKASITATGYIRFIERYFFPSWLSCQKNVSRFMMWTIGLQLNLSPELKYIHSRIDELELSVPIFSQTIVNYYSDVSGQLLSGQLLSVKPLRNMTDQRWSRLFKKMAVFYEDEELCLKVVLSPIIREKPIPTVQTGQVEAKVFHFVLDIQYPEEHDSKGISHVRQVVASSTQLIDIVQYREEDGLVHRYHALIGPETHDNVTKIRTALSEKTNATIYSHKARGD